jgi:hypothetical protein
MGLLPVKMKVDCPKTGKEESFKKCLECDDMGPVSYVGYNTFVSCKNGKKEDPPQEEFNYETPDPRLIEIEQ